MREKSVKRIAVEELEALFSSARHFGSEDLEKQDKDLKNVLKNFCQPKDLDRFSFCLLVKTSANAIRMYGNPGTEFVGRGLRFYPPDLSPLFVCSCVVAMTKKPYFLRDCLHEFVSFCRRVDPGAVQKPPGERTLSIVGDWFAKTTGRIAVVKEPDYLRLKWYEKEKNGYPQTKSGFLPADMTLKRLSGYFLASETLPESKQQLTESTNWLAEHERDK